MNCEDCRFHVITEDGYSNYTVEGSTFHCAKKLHPDGEFDRFYGKDKRLDHAAVCEGFEQGEGVLIFVEGDHDDFTPEQQTVYDMFNSKETV